MKTGRTAVTLVLKITVSAALLFFLYRNTPARELGAVLAGSRPGPLVLTGLIILVNTTLSAWKWRILLLCDHIDIPLPRLLASYFIGAFFNIFLPSTIGGDAYRIYDVTRESGQAARATASVFADRLSGFVALASLSFGGSMVVAARLDKPLLLLLPLFALGALILALYLLWRQDPVRLLLRVTRLDRVPRLTAFCDRFFAAFARYGSEPRTLLRVMGISFAFQSLLVVAVYLMALAIQARAPLAHFFAFVPLITLMEALPISVYGLGVRDLGYVFFFQWAGMGEAHTRALPIVFLAMTLCSALVGGALYARRVFSPGNRTRRSS